MLLNSELTFELQLLNFPGRCEQGSEGSARRLQVWVSMAADGCLSPRPAAESFGGRHREGLCVPRRESLSLLQTVTRRF